MANAKFQLDYGGGKELLTENSQLRDIQWDSMKSLISVVEAQFFQEFGTEGKFKIDDTVVVRYAVRISAADAKTASILKRNPKWLDQFAKNIQI